jgi:hypothetical protein
VIFSVEQDQRALDDDDAFCIILDLRSSMISEASAKKYNGWPAARVVCVKPIKDEKAQPPSIEDR